jgi:hypothetical protein
MLVSFLAYSSTLKMEATCSSETSIDFQKITLRFVSEGSTLHNHRWENLKFYMNIIMFAEVEMCSLSICPHVTIREWWNGVL